jgi:hypothetical protein
MTAANGPQSPEEADVLAYVESSLSDALAAIDGARSAVDRALVWTKLAEGRSDAEGGAAVQRGWRSQRCNRQRKRPRFGAHLTWGRLVRGLSWRIGRRRMSDRRCPE